MGENDSGALGTAGGDGGATFDGGDAGESAAASADAADIATRAATASGGARSGDDGGCCVGASEMRVTDVTAWPPASDDFEPTRPRHPKPVLMSADRLETASSAGAAFALPPLGAEEAEGASGAAVWADAAVDACVG